MNAETDMQSHVEYTRRYYPGLMHVVLRRLRSLYPDMRLPLVLFLISFSVFWFTREHVFKTTHTNSYCVWDACWYKAIVESGYATDGNRDVQHNVVFFPLYPLVSVAVKMLLGVDTAAAMLTVSSISTLLALIILYKVLLLQFQRRIAQFVLVLVALNPYSVFLYNGYSEPLFLLIIVLFFFCLLNREAFLGAALAAGLASAVRPYGCLLGVVFALELLHRHYEMYGLKLRLGSRFLRAVLVFTPLSFAGLAGYTLWLAKMFNDPLAFSHNMAAWGATLNRSLNWINLLEFRYIPAQVSRGISQGPTGTFFMGIVLFVSIPFLAFVWRQYLHFSFLAFLLIFFLFFHLMGHHGGGTEFFDIGRHLMVIFPALALVALTIDRAAVARCFGIWMDRRSQGQEAECLCWSFICTLPMYVTVLLFTALFVRNTILFYNGIFVS